MLPKDDLSLEHLKKGLKTRALKSARVTVLSQAANFGITTVGGIILARLLTPHDFGLVTMTLSISLLLANFGTNGFIEAIIQKEGVNSKQISNLFWINAAISFLLMLLFMASAPAIAWFYKEPLVKPIVVAMAVTILLPGLSNQHQAILKRRMEFTKTAWIDVVSTLVSIIVAIFLAVWGWGYWALVSKWVVAPFVLNIGVWSLSGWQPGLPCRGTGIRPMLKFASNTYGNFVLGYFRRNLDNILIGRFLGGQALGNYDRAYQLSHMLPNLLLASMNSVALASFSRMSREAEQFRRYFLRVLSTLAFVCMPLSAVLTLTGQDIILLLFGPQWKTAGYALIAFGLSIGVEMIYLTHSWLHLPLGTPDRWLRWSIASLAVTAVFLVIGLPWGPVGVAIAFSASNYVLLLPGLYYAGRPIGIGIRSIISTIAKYFLAALAAGLCSWFFLYSLQLTSPYFLGLHIVLRILVASGLCIAINMVVLVGVFRSKQSISQFASILRETVRKGQTDIGEPARSA